MKNKINECKTLEELTILWQSKYPNKVFVKDGIVNPDKWVTQEIKPMFLLKEAYGGKESWDLINDHILVKSKKQVDKTWKKVTQWTYGIMNTSVSSSPFFDENKIPKEFANEYLQSIAIVNVKKIAGGSTSVWAELEEAVDNDKDFLKKEIELIEPTVIVCGYTMSFLEKILGAKIKKTSNKNLYYFTEINGKKVIILDYYHPGNQYPDIMNYYALTNIYQLALQDLNGGE